MDGIVTNSSCCLQVSNEHEKGKQQDFNPNLHFPVQFLLLGSRKFDKSCNVQYNTYLPAGDNLWEGSADLHECAKSCYFSNECAGWTWNDMYCWLKTDASNPVIETIFLTFPQFKFFFDFKII